MDKQVCAHCGVEIEESFIFCCNCGEMIEDDTINMKSDMELKTDEIQGIEQTDRTYRKSDNLKGGREERQQKYDFSRRNVLQFMLGMMCVLLRDTISGVITTIFILDGYDQLYSYEGVGSIIVFDRFNSNSFWSQSICSLVIAMIGAFIVWFAVCGMFTNDK